MTDYYIYKSTEKFREVTKDDFLEFKFAGYMFFNKNKYSNDDINKQIRIIYDVLEIIGVKYLSCPLPPLPILKKIIIKEPIV